MTVCSATTDKKFENHVGVPPPVWSTRLKAIKTLGELELPVADVVTMKRESVPSPKGDCL